MPASTVSSLPPNIDPDLPIETKIFYYLESTVWETALDSLRQLKQQSHERLETDNLDADGMRYMPILFSLELDAIALQEYDEEVAQLLLNAPTYTHLLNWLHEPVVQLLRKAHETLRPTNELLRTQLSLIQSAQVHCTVHWIQLPSDPSFLMQQYQQAWIQLGQETLESDDAIAYKKGHLCATFGQVVELFPVAYHLISRLYVCQEVLCRDRHRIVQQLDSSRMIHMDETGKIREFNSTVLADKEQGPICEKCRKTMQEQVAYRVHAMSQRFILESVESNRFFSKRLECVVFSHKTPIQLGDHIKVNGIIIPTLKTNWNGSKKPLSIKLLMQVTFIQLVSFTRWLLYQNNELEWREENPISSLPTFSNLFQEPVPSQWSFTWKLQELFASHIVPSSCHVFAPLKLALLLSLVSIPVEDSFNEPVSNPSNFRDALNILVISDEFNLMERLLNYAQSLRKTRTSFQGHCVLFHSDWSKLVKTKKEELIPLLEHGVSLLQDQKGCNSSDSSFAPLAVWSLAQRQCSYLLPHWGVKSNVNVSKQVESLYAHYSAMDIILKVDLVKEQDQLKVSEFIINSNFQNSNVCNSNEYQSNLDWQSFILLAASISVTLDENCTRLLRAYFIAIRKYVEKRVLFSCSMQMLLRIATANAKCCGRNVGSIEDALMAIIWNEKVSQLKNGNTLKRPLLDPFVELSSVEQDLHVTWMQHYYESLVSFIDAMLQLE